MKKVVRNPSLRFTLARALPAARVGVLARVVLLAVFLLSCFPAPVRAQSESIRFTTLSVEDGLSQSTVRAILQDSKGLMWFGTDDGLNKYDGYSFTLYKHELDNPTSLADNTITAIFQDSHGELWFGTAAGLERFKRDSETFQHYQYSPNNPHSLYGSTVSAIVEDQQGNLWVGTSDGGLNRYNRKENNFTRFLHDSHNPNSPASDAVTALLVDNKGNLWIGTYEGLDCYEISTGKFTHYQTDAQNNASLSDNRVLSLFQDRMGTLWVGTEEGGLNRFNSANGTFLRYQSRPNNPYTLSNNMVRTIYEDQSGHLWVGGRDGLNLFDRTDDYFIHYQHDPNDIHSLSNDYVLSLYSDRSGVLWIGTFGGGLSKYVQSNERFTLYQHRPGTTNSLSSDVVYAITEDHNNTVWVGTMDGGLNRLDQEAKTFSVYENDPMDSSSLSNNDVRAVLEDRRDVLWVGTNGGGLNRFDPEYGRFIHFTHDANYPASIADNRVTALYEDRRGNLWVGTRSGLDRMDRDTRQFTHFRYDANDPQSISGDLIRVIAEDRHGNLWVGTNNGISVMNPDTRKFRRYQFSSTNPKSLSNDRVLSILETQDGVVWVGTLLGGLNRFDPTTETFSRYTQKEGLPSDAVYGILADRNGYLWLSTNRGLSRFDPRTEIFRNYDRRDGLQSSEFNPGAYHQNGHGRMYFGGIQGFNAFDPSRVEDSSPPPPLIITAFKKFNQIVRKDLAGGDKITLSYQDNFVSFEFAALDYAAPEKNQYAYKLEGFDKDWIYAGTRRYASYTNLRGGNYIFRVIGSNQEGIWNEVGNQVEIVVVPPVWETWWFISLVAFILIGAAVGSYRLRVMRMQSQNRFLEKLVHDRTQEIERRREVAEGLREILALLNSNQSLNESLDAIVSQVVRLMEARAVIIYRYGEEGFPAIVASNLPRTSSSSNGNGSGAGNHNGGSQAASTHSSISHPLPAWLTVPLLEGQRLILPDLAERRSMRPELEDSPFGEYSALLAVPLLVNDKVDGGIIVLYDHERPFFQEDIHMAMSFANHTALAIANAQLRSQAEEIAVSAERSRLARDLHDAVTQTLFATSLIAEVLPKVWERNPEVGKQKVSELKELTRGALAEMRTLLMELRPTALMDVPLTDLLQQLSEAFTGRARVPVTLDIDKSVELPANVKIGFYRIAQESLNNIQKHARASRVEMHLRYVDGRVELCIRDNGVGFYMGRTPPDHFGLGIMAERAQSVGALFSLDSEPGKGTCITVSWEAEE